MKTTTLAMLLLLVVPAAAAADESVETRLAETTVNVNFADTRLEDVLAFISAAGKVNLHLDPRVGASRQESELLVTIQADDISIRQLLALLTEMKKLAFDLRWSGVFVSTAERLAALPKKPELTEAELKKHEKLLAKLATKVNVDFDETPIRSVLDYLSQMCGAKMVVEPMSAAKVGNALVSFRAADATVLDVLSLALVPAGLGLDLADGVVVVRRPGTRDDWLRQDLAGAFGDYDFEDRPLPEVLAVLAKASGVPMHADPELSSRDPEVLSVTLRADRISVESVLSLVTITKGLAWDIRWGGVFVAGEGRLAALPKTVYAPGDVTEDWQRKLLEALSGEVSFSFDGAAVIDALEFIRTIKGLNILPDPQAREKAESSAVSLVVANLPLQDALSLLLVPRGMKYELAHEVILVTLRD